MQSISLMSSLLEQKKHHIFIFELFIPPKWVTVHLKPPCACVLCTLAQRKPIREKKKNRGLCSNHKTQYFFLSTSCLDYVGCCILKLYWKEGSGPVRFYCMLTNLLHTPAACGTCGFHSAKTNWPWELVASQNQMTQLDKCAAVISAESVCDFQ